MSEQKLGDLSSAWLTITELIGEIGVISSKAQLQHTVRVLDDLLDLTRGSHEHKLSNLIALLADLIEEYETRTLGESEAPPLEVLRFLMESNELRQADLAVELGGQSVVSAILSGAREINARQASALAARFRVSPALFIARMESSAAEHVRPQSRKLSYLRGATTNTFRSFSRQGPGLSLKFSKGEFVGRQATSANNLVIKSVEVEACQ